MSEATDISFPTTPTDKQIGVLANMLYQKIKDEKREKQHASIKKVLLLLGMGTTIAAAFIAPRAAYMLAKALREEEEWKNWRRFDQAYLRQTLRRLAKRKFVEIKESGKKQQIIITERGKKRILEYALGELTISKPSHWDKKWRVVIYDIPQKKKKLQEVMRRSLKQLEFLLIQESVYIIPYACYKEIEFLREYYGVGQYLKYLLVDKLEDDSAYKAYFGL